MLVLTQNTHLEADSKTEYPKWQVWKTLDALEINIDGERNSDPSYFTKTLLVIVEEDNIAKAYCFYFLILAEIFLISRFLKMPNLT